MHKQYPQKLRKLLSEFPSILPTQFEAFYSVFKMVCWRLSTQDVTPEIINDISKVYNRIKVIIDSEANRIQKQSVSTKEINANSKSPHASSVQPLQHQLHDLLQPLLSHLPSTLTAKLLYSQFLDTSFYVQIKQERDKAQAIVDEIMGKQSIAESGSMTPLGERKKLLGKLVNEKGSSRKIHINGTNELGIIFWINCFKSEYAVHFDVFWLNFQYYIHTMLVPSTSKPSLYFTIFPPTCNPSTKFRIHQIIDPDSKYYVTSANCNQLFIQLTEFQVIDELIELSLQKQFQLLPNKSEKCLSLTYRWLNQGNGTVNINSFTKQPSKPGLQEQLSLPTSIPPCSSMELPTAKSIFLTGSSVAVETKILNNKYWPTIRFGSLIDNQVCIKNKYVSRRQFMIIEELVDNWEYAKQRVRDDQSLTYRNGKRANPTGKSKEKISMYYLVCLSPTNHTRLTYPFKVEVKPGLIFKVQGAFVQILKFSEVYKGLVTKGSFKDKQKPNEIPNDSAVNINLTESVEIGEQNGNNFQMITMIPICKTQENEKEEEDKTLLELPKNKAQIIVDHQMQCMFISGKRKNFKFSVSPQDPKINLGDCIETQKAEEIACFVFEVEDGSYFLPPRTQILAKKANQVLNGHFSDKILLEPGMNILLEEIEFSVFE